MDPEPQAPPKPTSSMVMWIVLIIILILVAGGIYWWWQRGEGNTSINEVVNTANTPSQNSNSEVNVNTLSNENINTVDMNSWLTYHNSSADYYISYPSTWSIVKNPSSPSFVSLWSPRSGDKQATIQGGLSSTGDRTLEQRLASLNDDAATKEDAQLMTIDGYSALRFIYRPHGSFEIEYEIVRENDTLVFTLSASGGATEQDILDNEGIFNAVINSIHR